MTLDEERTQVVRLAPRAETPTARRRHSFNIYVKAQANFDSRGQFIWYVTRDGLTFAQGFADTIPDAMAFAEMVARAMQKRGF